MILTDQSIEQLTSQTAQLATLLTNFLQTLQSETLALQINDSDQITQILSIKEQQSDEITKLTEELNQTLQSAELNLTQLLTSEHSLTLPKNTRQYIQTIVELTTECHNLNQANGMSIQILNNMNQQTMNLISGKGQPSVNLYGSKGESAPATTDKQTLGKA